MRQLCVALIRLKHFMLPTHPHNATSQGVVALFEDAAGAIAACGKGADVTLWYLGEKAERFMALPGLSGDGVTIGELGQRLDAYADTLADDLLNLDRHMLSSEDARLAWDASLVSDLSPLVGDLQLNMSRFLLIADCLREGESQVFLVDDARLGQVLAQVCTGNGLSLRWVGPRASAPSLAVKMRARLSALKTAWLQKRQLNAVRSKAPAPWDQLRDCDALVFDWAEAESFPSGGTISRTRNLRLVPEILKAAGHKVGFVVSPLSWIQPYQGICENVCASGDAVVLVDECRPLSAILKGAWKSWFLDMWIKGRFIHNGFNMTRLVRLAREHDTVKPQASLAYAYGAIPRELARRGIFPKTIVYPYENQGWERVLLAEVRKWMPQTRLVAYQNAPFAVRYLSFYPFASTIESGRVPDRLVCMADHFAHLFRNHGFPAERLVVGGTVMFEDVLALGPRESKDINGAADKTVLCATSIKFSESLNLAHKVIQAARGVEGIKIVVNYHPVVDADFKARMQTLLDNDIEDGVGDVEFTSDLTRMRLDQVSAVFYNTSGAAFDALARGVPAYYVPVDGCVSQNKVPQALSSEPLSVSDMRNILSMISIGKSGEFLQPDRLMLQSCLCPVQESVFVQAVCEA